MNPSTGLLTSNAGISNTSDTILPGLIGIGLLPLKGGLRISGKIWRVWSVRRCRPERIHYKRTKYGPRDRQRRETKRLRPSDILIPVAPPGATMAISFQSDEEVLRKLRDKLRKMSDEELIRFGKEVRRLAENPFHRQLEDATGLEHANPATSTGGRRKDFPMQAGQSSAADYDTLMTPPNYANQQTRTKRSNPLRFQGVEWWGWGGSNSRPTV